MTFGEKGIGAGDSWEHIFALDIEPFDIVLYIKGVIVGSLTGSGRLLVRLSHNCPVTTPF